MRKTLTLAVFILTVFALDNAPSYTGTNTPNAPKTPLPTAQPKLAEKLSNDLAVVIRVVDGDTILVDIKGTQEKVRFIGVDTPESVAPRKPIQCFGEEASAFTQNLLMGNHVRLESDPTQHDRDTYGRLLRYVFLPDGTFINKVIIEKGYGHEYTYRTPYHYHADFKAAEHAARELGLGLWASGACGIPNN
ncbi:MAG: thermonuclease family protein [Minisyncoccota bacterium]